MAHLDELEALTKELAQVRRRGIARVESPEQRHEKLQLPMLRTITGAYGDLGLTFPEHLELLILDAINHFSDDTERETALILFGFLHELPAGYEAKRLADPTTAKLREKALEFYAAMRIGAEGISADTFRKSVELRLLSNIGAQIQAHAIPRQSQTIHPTAEDLLVERSTFHVVRTLEARRSHLLPLAAEVLDDVLQRFRNWHLASSGDSGMLVRELGWLCERYFGRGIYDLVGRIRLIGAGPKYSPQEQLPWCHYPGTTSLAFIPGGLDHFTGQEVEPFYLAIFPVTAYEWAEFLDLFNWQASNSWQASFEQRNPREHPQNIGRLPAIGMTFYDCLAYCFWLWGTTSYRFRLPTEAEWNFAATGGADLRYPWGDNPAEASGWFANSAPQVRAPIAVDIPPPLGPFNIVGLAGNVWEYLATLWQGDEPVSGSDIVIPDLPFALGHRGWWDEADDRVVPRIERKRRTTTWSEIRSLNPLDEVQFVMKGGSWGGGPEYAAMRSRIYSSLFNWGAYGGLRLAISAVRNPHTGDYELEQSPFIDNNLQQVRLVSSSDFAPPLSQGLTLVGCGGRLSPADVAATTGDNIASWDALFRNKGRPG